ncbi:MAG: glycosyltransferase [Cytophagales bacterium]
MSKVTILHIIESGGGSFNFILDLVKNIPHYHHVIVYGERTFDFNLDFSNDFQNASFVKWEFAFREISILNDYKAYRHLKSIFLTLNFDIVHLHSSKAGFLGRLALWQLRIKNVVFSTHCISFLRKDISIQKKMYFISIEILANFLCGKVVACSDSESKEINRYFINSVSIPNGVQIEDSYSEKEANSNKIIVGTVGRISEQKNPKLFNQLARYFEDHDNIEFIWIGSGEQVGYLDSKNVKVTGWLNKADLDMKMSEIDIYLSTSLWEGLPLSVLEAMNHSKPLILHNCIGNCDLVENNINGFLFDEFEVAVEKILFFVNNTKKIPEYGKKSKILVSNRFSMKKMVDKYLNLYDSICVKI